MIVVQLQGGLGNQMFQYAFGKALSIQTGEEFLLDTSFLEQKAINYTQRNFELNVFQIPEKIIEKRSLENFVKAESKFILDRIFRKLKKSEYITLREKSFAYQAPSSHSAKFKRYIGFWQSEKYFHQIRNELLEIFSFNYINDQENLQTLKNIQSHESISMHIRRGDYITNNAANAFHGSCDLEYYKASIKAISSSLRNPAVFIFSDDPQWVRENIQLDLPTYFINNNQGEKSYLDMGLMSQCRHHIIANSSFSWWGAWLNPSATKKVIAPQNWFANSAIDTNDLIPNTWLRL